MSETPRTDALYNQHAEDGGQWGNYTEMLMLCRDLERELKLWRAWAAEITGMHGMESAALREVAEENLQGWRDAVDASVAREHDLRAVIAKIQLHAGNTLSTASRDVGDWADDVATIGSIAMKAADLAAAVVRITKIRTFEESPKAPK